MKQNNKNIVKKIILVICYVIVLTTFVILVSLEINDYMGKSKNNYDTNIDSQKKDETEYFDANIDSGQAFNLKIESYKNNIRFKSDYVIDTYKSDDEKIIAIIKKQYSKISDVFKNEASTIFEESPTATIIKSKNDIFNFSIVNIDDWYIIISNTNEDEKINDRGKNIVVINKDGKMIDDFYNVGYEISTSEHTITITKCIDSLDNKCIKTTYLIKNDVGFYLLTQKIQNKLTSQDAVKIVKNMGTEKLGLEGNIEDYEITIDPYVTSNSTERRIKVENNNYIKVILKKDDKTYYVTFDETGNGITTSDKEGKRIKIRY